MTSIRRIKIDNNTYELRDARGSQLYVGTCSTAAATNPKVCTVEDFPVDENGKPYVGTEIVVKFTATNTSTSTTPELNVNGTGAIRIWYNNAVLASGKSSYAGYANRYLHYVYDGTYWVFMGHSVDNNSTYSNVALGQGYAVQNNSAASATITAALGSYALTVNGIVSVKFLYDVPANATLNINSKGAKAIYNKDAAITAGVIKAGDTATFIYSTYYHLIAVDSWQDKQDTIDDLATIRSGAALGATAIQQADLATVAISGSYDDLTNKPDIPDIDDAKPLVVTIASRTSGNNTTYSLANVTFNQMVAAYNAGKDLICDYDGLIHQLSYSDAPDRFFFTSFQGDEGSYTCFEIHGDNDISKYSGAVVPTNTTVNGKALSSNITLSANDVGALPSNTHIPADQVQSNWDETNTSSKAYIQNKPTIPSAQVNSDWDASSGVAQILNKPTFKTINGESIVGTGDIEVGSGDVATAFTITITSTTIEVQPMTGAMMTVGTDVSFQIV